MSCKCCLVKPNNVVLQKLTSLAAVARKSSVLSKTTPTTMLSMPPRLPSTLASAHLDAKLVRPLTVASPAALFNHASSSLAKNSSVSVKPASPNPRLTKKPLPILMCLLLRSRSKRLPSVPLPAKPLHPDSPTSPLHLRPSAQSASSTVYLNLQASTLSLRSQKRRQLLLSRARLVRLRTAALSTTGLALRAARSAKPPRCPRLAAASVLGPVTE